MTETRQTIQATVKDPTRSSALLGLVGQAEQTLGSLNSSFFKRSRDFGKMSADHSKTAADLQGYMATWDAEDRTQRARLVAILMSMRAQSTEAEWPAVSNAYINSILDQSDRYHSLQTVNL